MMMMENNLSSLIPVTFFDGEREFDMGTVQIDPSLTFKAFQSIMSQKLNISPHQITIYFERQNNFQQNHHRRRHPVTNKFDFSSILTEPNSSYFWVVQKRPRRTRRRKTKNYPGDNFTLLRRDFNGFEFVDYLQSMRVLERERYLMSMNLNSNLYNDLSYMYGGGGGGNGGSYGSFGCSFSDDAASSGGRSSYDKGCDVCNAVRGDTVPFHWCKYDAVTNVFRSPAGPIAPPKKNDDFLG